MRLRVSLFMGRIPLLVVPLITSYPSVDKNSPVAGGVSTIRMDSPKDCFACVVKWIVYTLLSIEHISEYELI
jgi:hypothetical protein